MTTLPQDVEADLRRRIFELEQRLETTIAQRDEAVERQTATALVNFRLQNELRATVERQNASAEILRTIASTSGDAEHALQRIAETTRHFFNAASVTIRIAEGDEWVQTVRVGASSHLTGWQPAAQLATRGANLPGTVYQDNRQIHIPDLDNIDPSTADWPVTAARAAGIRTVCGSPLRREGKAIGVFIVYRDRLAPFTSDELAIQQSFADQAVIAIENARLFNETREALERQTATSDILKVIASSPADVQPVFDVIVERAVRLCGARMGRVYRYDGKLIHMVGGHGLSDPGRDSAQRPFPRPASDDTIVGRVMLSRQPNILADLEEDDTVPPLSRQMISSIGARSQVTMPMLLKGEPIGAITLSWTEPRGYSDQQIALLQTFADQAVIAIENVRLFNEVQARTRDLEDALTYQTGSANILRVIASSPTDVNPVLKAIVESACELCEAYDAVVMLKEGGELRLGAHHGPIPMNQQRWRDDRSSVSGRAIADRQPVHVRDVLSDEGAEFSMARDMSRRDGCHTLLGTPLLREGQAIGAIVLRRAEVHPFSDKQIELLKTFADQAVIAIGNVQLFDEVQAKTRDLEEALEQQIATSEVLGVISSSAGDLAPVFDAMLANAMRLCGANFGVLNTFDGTQFHTAATHGLPPAYDEFRRRQPLDYGPATAPARLLQGEPFVEIVDLLDSDAYRSGEPNRRALVDIGGARSLLAVPLLRDERVVGNVMIFRQDQRPFSEKQITLLQQFAAQAVIAIENARLLGELRQRTADLSESLQFQTASADVLKVISRSPDALQPVLDVIVETSRELCNALTAVIFLLRDGKFHDVAESSEKPEYVEALRANPISPDQVGSVLARAAREKRTIHVPNTAEDPEAGLGGPISRAGPRALLTVPLIRDGEVIGGITLRQSHLTPFTPRQIEAVETFADQAVISISNVSLFEQVQQRTRELSKSLDDLRTAQDRLIQTEKLASLGQLTAGIAHEIKNPLNFVNNFAALSAELTDELNDHLKSTMLADATRKEVDELTALLKDNLGKVVQHGKRADSIVKNMLLHSREGSGEHRPADVNALVDESLNLAYHGARAEKPQFNVTLERDFDPAAGTADVFPQEITRVLLNLISNGFYAVTRRKADNGAADFEPTVRATTLSRGDHVEIRIRDNGTGIPAHVKEKMFNPFFTTKPAGEGTGLGLSMSHDIIVKQHGGTIEVETEPGAFTEFRLVLPRASIAQGKAGN